MAHDYEDMHSIDGLDDTEIRDLVREQLSQHTGLDIADITVNVAEGAITLSGRVGTDGERRIAEHVLTDVLGVQEFTNDLVVDSLRRATSPEDVDLHLADEAMRSGTLLGDVAPNYSDESAHLASDREVDLDGSSDIDQATDGDQTWAPPSSPTPEGMSGTDAT